MFRYIIQYLGKKTNQKSNDIGIFIFLIINI